MTLRPEGTILAWVLTNPTNKTGQAQQFHHQMDMAHPRPMQARTPRDQWTREQLLNLPEETEHPRRPPLATWGPPLEEVLVESLAWLTNGSAKLKAGGAHWAAMATHHMDGHLLMETRGGCFTQWTACSGDDCASHPHLTHLTKSLLIPGPWHMV